MTYRILLPLDGSSEGENALNYTRMLGEKIPLSVELLRCFEPPAEVYTLPQLDSLAADVLAEHHLEALMQGYLDTKQAELEGVTCQTLVRCGDPASEILSRAPEADFVVMSRHGRGGLGRWLVGGVTGKVARSSPKPVLVVPGQWTVEPSLEQIMVCLDGSELAEEGLAVAAGLARAVSAKLLLYRFVPLLSAMDPEGELLEAKAYVQSCQDSYPDLVSQTFVQPGAMHHHIVTSAKELDIDLIVLGSHGRQGIVRWLLGSTAEHVLHHAHCPVLITHRQKAD